MVIVKIGFIIKRSVTSHDAQVMLLVIGSAEKVILPVGSIIEIGIETV
jgi:hypothetical protein